MSAGVAAGAVAAASAGSWPANDEGPPRAELVTSAEDLQRWAPAWDDLARRCARPCCAPAWMLAWWRHVAPAHARLRTVVVLHGNVLVGLAPYFTQRAPAGFTEHRLLASGTGSRLELLARPGHEHEVAYAAARALADADPRPRAVRFEGISHGSPWPGLLADSWPGAMPAARVVDIVHPGPTVALTGSFDDWLAQRSSNFRQQMRRMRRRMEAEGGRLRCSASRAELDRDLGAFRRLHHARWAPRGGSGALIEGVDRMLRDAGGALLDEGRFRLWCLDVDGETVSAHLFLAAGGELHYFNGGFDERWARLKPAMLTILAALQDAFERGDRRLDLGAGDQPYKLRFADGDDPVAWAVLFPRDARYPLTRAQALPAQAVATARRAGRRLPPAAQAHIKRVARRAGRLP